MVNKNEYIIFLSWFICLELILKDLFSTIEKIAYLDRYHDSIFLAICSTWYSHIANKR